MSPLSPASVSSTAGVDATLASTDSRTDSVATTTPLTSTSVPKPNTLLSNDGKVAAPASPTTKKKQKRNRGSGKNKNKNKNKPVPNPAATPAVDPVPNVNTSKIGRDPAWDACIMAILHKYLAEYLNNRLPSKNTTALNGEVNARITDRLGPMCGFNLANLMAKQEVGGRGILGGHHFVMLHTKPDPKAGSSPPVEPMRSLGLVTAL
jgi:hypothetical protein